MAGTPTPVGGDPLVLTAEERDELLVELASIAAALDELPDDSFARRIDLRERQRELRTLLRQQEEDEVIDLVEASLVSEGSVPD